MQSKQVYYSRSRIILGLSIMVCIVLSANLAPVAKHFLAQPQRLSVNDRRPLAVAMETLERQYGTIITYEDAPYIHETDVEDHTALEWKQAHPNGPRALIPKRASLEITYQISRGSGKADEVRSTIQKLLDTHAENNNPGRFRLYQEGEIFHIIPRQVRDSSGGLVNTDSLLDVFISFPEREYTAFTVIELITRAVGRAKGVKFVVGTVPVDFLEQTPFRRGANNEKARDVLINALNATGRKLSWQIFYDPGMKWYALNVHIVR